MQLNRNVICLKKKISEKYPKYKQQMENGVHVIRGFLEL